jgi:hypothetical protein
VPLAPSNVDGVNTPTLVGLTCIAGHPPAKPARSLNRWYIHHGRNKTFRVAAPSLTTCNRVSTIGADGAVIAAHEEAPASDKNILKRIAPVTAELQHTAVIAEVGILARCLKIEVLSKG